MGKSKKHQSSKTQTKTETIITHCVKSCKPKPRSYCGCNCKCEQLFYEPLPALPMRPLTQQPILLDWLTPGSVQTCCSICSTVKPNYN